MARQVIGAFWGRDNLNALNDNFKELYYDIASTERRITNNLWEEIKARNTIKMTEPVETFESLPETAKRNTLKVVIDEQRVYSYVNDQWQSFNQIDLDPFEPFKEELQAIISEYEQRIKDITNQVTNTRDEAINNMSKTKAEGVGEIRKTSVLAVQTVAGTRDKARETIEDLKQQAKSDIDNYREESYSITNDLVEYIDQATKDFQQTFNDYTESLETKGTDSLSEIESKKEAALKALNDFGAVDTSEWQKYALTKDDGRVTRLSDFDFDDETALDDLKPGFYYAVAASGTPFGASSSNAFVKVFVRDDNDEVKRIEFTPYNSNEHYIKWFYNSWSDWERMNGSRVTLYEGSISGEGTTFSLDDDITHYAFLIVEGRHSAGNFITLATFNGVNFVVRTENIYNNASNAAFYEMHIDHIEDNREFKVISSKRIRADLKSNGVDDSLTIQKIMGVS